MMKHTLFLYNFAKFFIPGSILLLIIFSAFHHNPKVTKVISTPPQATIQRQATRLPETPSPIVQKKEEIPVVRELVQPQVAVSQKETGLPKQPPPTAQKKEGGPVVPSNVSPSYTYIVAFKSGGTMKAKEISINNDIVTIWVEDGYSVKMPKNNIEKIDKQIQ